MTRVSRLEPEFVDVIPDRLDTRTLYISIPYATAQHLCCCGCGHEIVTPLHPAHWALTYDGETVSLHPSVGNWSPPCRSHYVIRRNQVRWARGWSREEVEAGRRRDRHVAAAYFSEQEDSASEADRPAAFEPPGVLRRMMQRLIR